MVRVRVRLKAWPGLVAHSPQSCFALSPWPSMIRIRVKVRVLGLRLGLDEG
jgi:hypothetical protein